MTQIPIGRGVRAKPILTKDDDFETSAICVTEKPTMPARCVTRHSVRIIWKDKRDCVSRTDAVPAFQDKDEFMPAYSLPFTSQCKRPLCPRQAKEEVYDRWNGFRGRYCVPCAKRLVRELNQSLPGEDAYVPCRPPVDS